MLMSGLAGFAGIILTSRLSASISTLGLGLELRSITASIIGGASLMGGVGNIFGAFLGTLFMGLANNFMVTAKIDVSWQIIIISSILLFAVTMDALVKKSQVKR